MGAIVGRPKSRGIEKLRRLEHLVDQLSVGQPNLKQVKREMEELGLSYSADAVGCLRSILEYIDSMSARGEGVDAKNI